MRRAVAVVAGLTATLIVAAAGAALAATSRPLLVTPLAHGVAARVQGRFLMDGLITEAVNVRGEYPDELIGRFWTIRPYDCVQSTCDRLAVTRSRGSSPPLRITLKRIGHAYRGSAAFTVGLKCLGRTYAHGSTAPYTITLAVTTATDVDGILFATHIAATYRNPRRTDATRCPLGPSHDAAQYQGALLPATQQSRPRTDRLGQLGPLTRSVASTPASVLTSRSPPATPGAMTA